MQMTETHAEGLQRTYSVVVPAADLERQLSAKIAEVQPRVRINGFRPGKVPASHIRKIYGAGFMQDLINEAVQKSTQQSIEKANVRPASEPQLDLKSDLSQVQAGKADLSFEVKFEVMPEFEPMDLSAIEIERPIADVADAQVEEALSGLLKANTAYETKDGAAADGDQIVLDFLGKLDGEPFEGGAAEGATLRIGAGQFIPGFEEALIGVKAGEERTIDVTFPDAYPVEKLAGQKATFDTKIKEVKAPKDAEATDEFAKQLGRAQGAHPERSQRAIARQGQARALRQAGLGARFPAAARHGRGRVRTNLAADRTGQGTGPARPGRSGQVRRSAQGRVPQDRRAPRAAWAAAGGDRPAREG
jgi:trigger factor